MICRCSGWTWQWPRHSGERPSAYDAGHVSQSSLQAVTDHSVTAVGRLPTGQCHGKGDRTTVQKPLPPDCATNLTVTHQT